MRELPLFVDGDASGGKQLLPINWFANPSGAEAVQSVMFDVGGEDMYGVITVSDWYEEVRDIAFIFLISLQPSLQVFCHCPSSSVHRFLQGKPCLPHALPDLLLATGVLPAVHCCSK